MKKVIVLLSIITLFITGCTNINTYSIDKVIEKVMKKDNKLKNVNFEGYSYYVPRGLKFINKNQYNACLSDKNNNYYYFYIDVVSRYHKVNKKYKEDKNAYYSKSIKSKSKYGYLEINKIKDKYFIEAMYNFMKVEAYISKENLNNSISNICLILSSIKYNDSILDTIVGENILNYKEENYNIFKTKKKTSDFLDYVKEYDSEKSISDEDNLKIQEGE